MSYSFRYPYRGDPGPGKRPDELPKPEPAPFDLTVDEARAILGVGRQTVREWIAAGRLPSQRQGRRIYLRRRDVERLAEQRRLPS